MDDGCYVTKKQMSVLQSTHFPDDKWIIEAGKVKEKRKKKLSKTNLLGVIVASRILLSCSTAVVWLDMSSFLEAGNGFAVTDWPVIEFVSIHLTVPFVCKFLQCTEPLFFKPMSRLK